MAVGLPDRVALGTLHGKEKVISPALSASGVHVLCIPIDTDRFGTFTAEVPRVGTMVEAARAKARAAIAASGLPVGMASEGAYGPHPVLPYLPVGQELLLWHDARTGQEIVEMMTDDRAVFDQAMVPDAAGLGAFLARCGFPDVAVCVAEASGKPPIAKGLRDRAALDAVLAPRFAAGAGAFVMTDMRAHMNPRRMQVIGQLAHRFAARLATPCPACAAPGFGRLRGETGLPCDACGCPTALIEKDISGCTACGYETETLRAGRADPAHCPLCNP